MRHSIGGFGNEHQCDEAEDSARNVHEERPAPGEVVGEEPTSPWAQDRGNGKNHTRVTEVPTQFVGGHDIGNERHSQGCNSARTDSLKHASGDQHWHRLSETAQHRSDHERHDGDDEYTTTTEDVAEFSVHSHCGDLREQVTGRQPRKQRNTA
ncbi:unannotated protein [freshwater metagenome]|uniref:Unannotated protein n=1 Tax=freshwater metagenome TaxID=449393 RepID=A0A6J6JQJ6_9ZZZZ